EFDAKEVSSPGASDPAASSSTSEEKKRRAERLAGHMLMWARVDSTTGRVVAPTVSSPGQLLLDIARVQEANRAYNQACLSAVTEAARPGNTHYLGRAASLPAAGYTDYMAACQMQCVYLGSPLNSIGEAAAIKNGANIAFLIPRRDRPGETQIDDNTTRAVEYVMGEAADHLTKMQQTCLVNEDFGTYEDIMGLLGNLWLQPKVFFTTGGTSALEEFAELVGDACCVPVVKAWLKSVEASKPEVAFAILNACEQAYLLASGQTRNRTEMAKAAANNWDAIDSAPYVEVLEIGRTLVAKLDSAARGGECFTACRLYNNSRRATAVKRAADEKQARMLLDLKRTVERQLGDTGERPPKKTRKER
ncbi:MAG: hypothetical protein GY873_34645, partial [Bosea sp.]|uniref:hypothetical protein n=1 Tax=Bosea sp. (in: a-proteobacteria) TaxID=1871050 RepID=UPI00238BB380|nr:hypothetical protein [Bosea sp. (in: a-proteobacteria)]